MKFSDEVLLEIVDIVRHGILTSTDISDMLRNVELDVNVVSGYVCLQDDYRDLRDANRTVPNE